MNIGGEGRRDTVILGIPFSRLTNEQMFDRFDAMIEQQSRNMVITVNLDCTVRAMKDPVLNRIMYGAALVTPDGMPIVWAGKSMKPSIAERVAGSDFIPLLLERAARKGHSVFFLGSEKEIALEAAEKCMRKYPGLKIVGVCSPPYATVWEMDNASILERINAAAPDILLVAFGNPKQEYWMAMHYAKLNVPVVIGVGATIDFLSGRVPRAPNWMKPIGAEWLFRLSLEPRRLTRRYATDLYHGLLPLVLQVAMNGIARSINVLFSRHDEKPLSLSKLSLHLDDGNLNVAVAEFCSRAALKQLAADVCRFAAGETDALVLDLRQSGVPDSELISDIVAIDQQFRHAAKQCILITTALQNVFLRTARIMKSLVTVKNRNAALEHLRRVGKRSLGFSIETVAGDVRILSLHGELTNDSAFLLEEAHQYFWEDGPLLLDLSNVKHLDTGGLECLKTRWIAVRGDGEPIRCINTNKHYASLLNYRGLRELFFVAPTREQALSSLRTARERHSQTVSQLLEKKNA
jgi:N-acetylglucosaminyldiphosphoundecaprenol N-acetyl-beta-D-mannosaminyltransferase